MAHNGYSLIQNFRIKKLKIRAYAKELYDYSNPLFLYAFIGFIVGILDRWMLQYFCGRQQQGFFGFAYQIAAICFIFTKSLTPLITREFSIAFEKQDIPEMARLYRRFIPILFSITAYFACFISVEAKTITHIIGGANFDKASAVVRIMAFFPIHQTYGQLNSSVFYATAQTKLYRNIGIFFMIIGLPIAYILIAQGAKIGFNFGSTGLAVKIIIIQMCSVNVKLYYNCKLLKLKFWYYLLHQGLCIFFLVCAAITSKFCMDIVFGLNNEHLVTFFLSGFLYTVIVVVIIYHRPIVFGLNNGDLSYVKEIIKRKYR